LSGLEVRECIDGVFAATVVAVFRSHDIERFLARLFV